MWIYKPGLYGTFEAPDTSQGPSDSVQVQEHNYSLPSCSESGIERHFYYTGHAKQKCDVYLLSKLTLLSALNFVRCQSRQIGLKQAMLTLWCSGHMPLMVCHAPCRCLLVGTKSALAYLWWS